MSSSSSYGVWAAHASKYTAQTPQQDSKSPHITLYFEGGSNKEASAAINVKSTDSDSRLVYWVNKSFSHPITEQLSGLKLGLHSVESSASSALALDFQRTTPALMDLAAGTIVEPYESGPNNDILDLLEPILDQAIKEKATIYVYGQSYQDSDGSSGIHDVHMNQGNTGDFENATYSDGSFLVNFADGHWEAVFLAFASQELPTDDSGKPTSAAKAFDQTLSSSTASS
ncbi:hypothetical protein GGR56DRAFT_567856 [Xylariaceae sp. FL0804]|nr:hypothetical protein GGR56DRAFT_567856 [Xylariaceae sp. FL0804]